MDCGHEYSGPFCHVPANGKENIGGSLRFQAFP
jgi:hypothetical protein